MQFQREIPAILETWLEYLNAHERLIERTAAQYVEPPFPLLVTFACEFVAGVSGGAADPTPGCPLVLLPSGERALIAVASEERGSGFGLVADPDTPRADWVALVVFRRGRPVALHVIPSAQLATVRDALGASTPAPPGAPSGAVVLSTMLHWDLCLERLVAEVCGVRTYYVTVGGLSLEPHPVPLPPVAGHTIKEVA